MHPSSPSAGFPFESVGLWTTRRALLTPERTAVEFRSKSWTYKQLEDLSNSKAAGLRNLGIKRGERVAVVAHNSVNQLALLFGCAKIGAVMVPINWRGSQDEINYVVQDCGAKVVLQGNDVESLGVGLSPDAGCDDIRFSDPLMFIYTSGTTGKPKGTVLTHGVFFWTNLNIILSLDILSSDRSIMALPMFHIGGWNVNTLSLILKGATLLLEEAFDPDRVLDAIEHRGATWLMGVPSIFLFVKEHPRFETADLSSLRFVVCGGAPAPLGLIETYESRGVKFIQGYGLTEAGPNSLLLPAEFSQSKIGSAGRPYFFTDVRLSDSEIQLRGPSVMSGYHNLEGPTKEAFTDEGFLRSGDMGTVDDDGFYYVVDRLKDMIITGGENVYPAEVENVLCAHPDVVEAGVIGVPDDKWGESVCAVVVTRNEIEPSVLVDWCRDRLAHFKCPKSVVFTDVLPRTASGKILKKELRDQHRTTCK